MNKIQIFKNEQFGQIRTVVNESGEPMFAATDVCNALGYSNSRKAIADHTDAEERCNISLQRGGEMTFINESGLYSLIIRSNKEEAKPFRKWITSEILPSIRKNGYYVNNKFATNHLTPTKVRASIEWVKGVREVLNLNDSSTLLMLKQVSEPLGLQIEAAFDTDKTKIGTKVNDIEIFHIDQFRAMAAERKVVIGIITVPAEHAQNVADLMVAWGIKAIWNFTPARIKVPTHIVVQNTTIYMNLAILFNKLYNDKGEKK